MPDKINGVEVPTAGEVLDQVKGILSERQAAYSHPVHNFQNIADMWRVVFGQPVTTAQVALALECLKICRELTEPKEDNHLDGIGYWVCEAQVKAYEQNLAATAPSPKVTVTMPSDFKQKLEALVVNLADMPSRKGSLTDE